MLNEMLVNLLNAIEQKDKAQQSQIVKNLNRLGMDNYTICVLLKELKQNG